jgi:FtsP/CotA-like multicopper oxidase with cupredoxin domain
MLALAAVLLASAPATAQVDVQCPGDLNDDGVPDPFMFRGNGTPNPNQPNPAYDPNVQCMHLSGGDGFATMADGRPQYIFSFADLTGVGDGTIAQPDGSLDILTGPDAPDGDISDDVMAAGALAAAWPAPAIVVDEGKRFYLSLTNVGMVIRPDLFDPHTVHFHGFPNSSTVFDGLPESGISINMGATLTYYYNLVEPGTFMYHCHVEATEHMQMGMLGNLYVRAAQSWDGYGADPAATTGNLGRGDMECGTADDVAGVPCGYAYNDGDGSTAYDVEAALQLGSFDHEFHDASWTVQPLPFANMWDRYPMINGRGYPDTIDPNPLPAPAENGGIESQVEHSLVTATAGERILLRLSNLNITSTHTLISPSIPMEVVGIDAKQLRSTTGENLYYTTNSVTMGGGMSADVILDTTDVPAGDYYLYAANLQYLANFDEDAPTGGMMTKIVIN